MRCVKPYPPPRLRAGSEDVAAEAAYDTKRMRRHLKGRGIGINTLVNKKNSKGSRLVRSRK